MTGERDARVVDHRLLHRPGNHGIPIAGQAAIDGGLQCAQDVPGIGGIELPRGDSGGKLHGQHGQPSRLVPGGRRVGTVLAEVNRQAQCCRPLFEQHRVADRDKLRIPILPGRGEHDIGTDACGLPGGDGYFRDGHIDNGARYRRKPGRTCAAYLMSTNASSRI